MKQKKLKNAPLQEVIFQLSWELAEDKNGIKFDPEFDMAIGLFSKSLEEQYPIKKRLVPPHEPVNQTSGIVYQFRQNELQAPVIQIGHGILTVNDTDANYIWEDNYRSTIQLAIDALKQSYQSNLTFNNISLQYVDAVETPDEAVNPTNYVNNNFNVNVTNSFSIGEAQRGIALSQVFVVNESLYLRINIQSGINGKSNKNAIIWSIQAFFKGPLIQEQLLPWLDAAHDLTSDTFVDMLKPDFYGSFN